MKPRTAITDNKTYLPKVISFSLLAWALTPNVAWASDLNILPTVTADAPSSEDNVPYSTPTTSTKTVQVISPQMVRAINPTGDFSQALVNNVPNIYTTGARGNTSIYLRGMSSNQINFTLDGIPMNQPSSYGFLADARTLPPPFISYITVQPGAGSAATVGDSNVAGTIAIHSLSPTRNFQITPFIWYGSYQSLSEGVKLDSGMLFKNTLPTRIVAGYIHTHADSYLQDVHKRTRNYYFKSITALGPGHLTLLFYRNTVYANRSKGITTQELKEYGRRYSGLSNDPNTPNYYGYNFAHSTRTRMYIKYRTILNRAHLSASFYYFIGRATVHLAIPNKSAPGGFWVARLRATRDHSFGGILKANYFLSQGELKTGLWIDSDNQGISRFAPILYNRFTGIAYSTPTQNPVHTTSIQPYVEFKWHPNVNLTITPGIKGYYLYRSIAGLSGKFKHHVEYGLVLPSFGMNYRLIPGLHAYFNYTRTAEAPPASQLTASYLNTMLAPQIANSYELGLIWHRNRWQGRFTAFRTDFMNYIESVPVQIGSQVLNTYTSNGGALYQGLGLSAVYRINRQLSAFINAGLLDAQLTTIQQPVLDAPHHTESFGLSYSSNHWSGLFTIRQVGSAFYDATSKVNDYFTSDVSLGYKFNSFSVAGVKVKNASVHANIDNIFNRLYAVTATSSASGPLYQYSRPTNFLLQFSATF